MTRVSIILRTATVAALAASPALGQVTIRGQYNSNYPPGVAVLPVAGAFGDSVRAILQRDLDYSDRFVMVALQGNDLAPFRAPNGNLDYQLFSGLGAKWVVWPTITPTGIHIQLHYVDSATVAQAKDYAIPEQPLDRDWRMRLHVISDAIQEYITGSLGAAATRIAYYRNPSIYIVDSDGAKDIPVPVDSEAIRPRWHPSGQSLVYTTLGAGSRIITVDLRTWKSSVVVQPQPNVTVQSAVYTPDGMSLYYTRSTTTAPAIYRASAPNWQPQRILGGDGFDYLETAVTPGGNRLAFVTNRLNHPEVYMSYADGTDMQPVQNWPDLAQKTAYRCEPDWSPDGTRLVFSSQVGSSYGAFQLKLITLRDGNVQQLTSDGVNAQPSWAPDGRHIVFTSDRSGSNQLWVLDIESLRTRQLTHAAGSKLAAWSPRLP